MDDETVRHLSMSRALG